MNAVDASFLWTRILSFLSLLLAFAIPVGLVLIVVGLIQFFRPDPGPDAEEVLRRRYALGEISESEYREMLKTLEVPPPEKPS